MRNPSLIPVCRWLLMAALTLAIAPAARAETVTADFAGVSPGQAVSVTLNGVQLKNIAAGVFNWFNVNPADTFLGASFSSFCIELDVGVLESATFTTTALEPRYTSVTADRLREFWGENFSKIGTNPNFAAAFQLGLWEIVHEAPGATLDVTTGNFKIDNAPNNIAAITQSWLSAVDGTGTLEEYLVVLDSESSQDQITVRPPDNIIPVPPAVVLGGMGLISLVGFGLRRRRHTKAGPAMEETEVKEPA